MRLLVLPLILAAGLLLAGCGSANHVAPAIAPDAGARASATKAAALLKAQVHTAFQETFKKLDHNGDDALAPNDFELDDKRFLNLFRGDDKNNDTRVSFAEYLPEAREKDLTEHCEAKSRVAQRAYGRINLDKTHYALDIYLKRWLNKRDRKAFVEAAFTKADANGDKVLNLAEFAHTIALVEALTDEKYIQKRVARSKAQTN